jgi:hypothetical protein
LITLRSD